ncbi:exosome-associated protein 4, putative [Trypanosoma brucei gambiense DAL972]|uniref:Exosome-associated protein 4, putative n=1 Tax=Trypanosoma brucei gambiense (strain MHOM/CI/86/DAL972) TaxID=679716 RepID=D0A8W6_TRYB9|nr:exosome-associated protein 4, putative [Trypanosoma brucei gambiense DAL972]CBH18117.1 exosome-associated protein 4, putative [Trypanosoma brucei gambiense DAL972]|eukprot:XP_011780381.1 exosome-associated protein 4, putative [Trypanosoma brucei gambiense DAL972]
MGVPTMERSHGRRSPDEVRYPHIVLNVLGQSYSSACIEVGSTRVVCAVHHPQQLIDEYRGSRGRVACTVRRSSRAQKHGLAFRADVTPEKDLALALEGVVEQAVVLEKIPQLLVEVVVEILAEDGGLWDAIATGVCAALASGGFEMYDTFSACGAALLPDGSIVTDPSATEWNTAKATAVTCAMLNSGNMCFTAQRGSCEPTTALDLVTAALKGTLARKNVISSQLCEQFAF